MSQYVTIAFREWDRDRRIDIPASKNNARTPTVMIRLGHDIIEMSRYEFAAALDALQTAMTTGGTPEAWRAIIKTSERDLVEEMRAAIHCDVAPAATPRHPNGAVLVIGFDGVDQAEAAKAALNTLLHFRPPVQG